MKQAFQLAKIHQNHAVYQQGKPLIISGVAPKNAVVRLDIFGKVHKTRARNSEFSFRLLAQAAQTIPFTYTVSTRTAEITVEDCLIGDVFLIAGDQTVTSSLEAAGSWRGIPDPLIRVIDVANANSQWNRPTSLTIGTIGALSYHFADFMRKQTRTPIGIVQVAMADASVFAFLRGDELYSTHRFHAIVSEYKSELKKYSTMVDYDRAVTQANVLEQAIPMGPSNPLRPAGIYETWIRPLADLALNGIVFSQGEADIPNVDLYEAGLRTMIYSLRKHFEEPKLPIILTQMQDCGEFCPVECVYPMLREAQSACINPDNQVFLASTIDLGAHSATNSRNQTEIAKRIGSVFLEHVYRKARNMHSPSYFSHSSKQSFVIYTAMNHLPLVSRSQKNMGIQRIV
ncbi:MAG: sialate O-acetylesterase [Bacillus subtilis]|nr:sialate O-acetylesterase [Bacillus subtilis]